MRNSVNPGFAVTRATLLSILIAVLTVVFAMAFPWGMPASAQTAALKAIQLPKPDTTGGMPLMQALAHRHTTRAFRDQALPLQTLSNLLWAAFGVNRESMDSGHPGGRPGRTAPSAMNSQDIELYVVLADGVYVYDARQNSLRPIAAGDARPRIGGPPAAHAAVTIVYVGPASDSFEQVDTGFIAQNVYLFAASEGLNAWFYTLHGAQENSAAAAALNLDAGHVPLYAQSVGFPPQ
jgi:nitroreductase